MKKTDIGVVAFMYAVCGLFLGMSLQLKKAAQTYPMFIITLLFILTTAYLIQMLVQARTKGITSGLNEIFQGFLPGQFFPILGMIIAYLIIMYLAGFYPATILLMAGCLIFLRVPKLQILLATAAVLLLVYGAFTMFLGVRLPMGILFK